MRASKEQLDEILELQEILDEEEQERGRVYEKYGSAGEDLLGPIGEVAELCKVEQPEAVLRLLKEFLL
jgi:hypothetical protein